MRQADAAGLDSPADLVLRGGSVLALDDADTRGTALAVKDGLVLAVGRDAEVEALCTPRTRIIELDGRAVIPGINDSHLHAAWLGASWPHTVMGSSAPAAPGADAELLGSAHADGAGARLVVTEADRRRAILDAGELLAGLGITSYTEPGLGPGEDEGETGCFTRSVFDSYVELEREGALRARVTVLALFGILDGASDLASFRAGLRGVPAMAAQPADPRRLRLAGVKIFADGIPPMLRAWTRHAYPDGTHGSLLVTGDCVEAAAADLRAMVIEAAALGLQLGVHATGDRTIATVVDAVAESRRRGHADGRHYVIHGDLVEPSTLTLMARLGVGLNTQAGIATRTAPWVSKVLGAETAAAAWPLERALDSGVGLSLSSDAPVLEPDWRRGIAAADEWMGPVAKGASEQRMLALLRAYTAEPARQDAAESWKGTLEPGKVADLCVLEADPLRVTPAELPAVGIESTLLGGEVVYAAQSAFAG